MQDIDNNISNKLPDGYDVIDAYQSTTEQAVVDNLFDYLGKTYYKTNHMVEGNKIRNRAISKYDSQLFSFISRKIWIFCIWAGIFIALTIGGGLAFGILVGDTIPKVTAQIVDFAGKWNWLVSSVEILIYTLFAVLCLFAVIALFTFVMIWYWLFVRLSQRVRVKHKVSQWNNNFARFTSNLTKTGLKHSIQSAIPNLVFDKATPAYDKCIFNLHNRIYSFANIPQDARKLDYKNLNSGFYKGNAFSLSYSAWEWFREAKVVSHNADTKNSAIAISTKRSLKRFTDSICVLTLDTFAEPKLNFVLNNPDGKNIKLQNEVFNKVFTLAVNNPKLAYTVFTPYVQHNLTRCKTWSESAKAIRQVIKEGSKIHVVFDGKSDFFEFDTIVDPKLNQVFISKEKYINSLNQISKPKKTSVVYAKTKFGSLDDTASLMVEYVLEELDIFYAALEMGVCLPIAEALKNKTQYVDRTLYSVLESKKLSIATDPSLNQLNQTIKDESQANVEFDPKKPTFNPDTTFNVDSSAK